MPSILDDSWHYTIYADSRSTSLNTWPWCYASTSHSNPSHQTHLPRIGSHDESDSPCHASCRSSWRLRQQVLESTASPLPLPSQSLSVSAGCAARASSLCKIAHALPGTSATRLGQSSSNEPPSIPGSTQSVVSLGTRRTVFGPPRLVSAY